VGEVLRDAVRQGRQGWWRCRRFAGRAMMFKKTPPRIVPSSLINEIDEVRAKRRQDLEDAVRKAVPYLGADEIERIVHDIVKGQQGNTPKEERNARILAKWYSAPGNKSKTAREFVEDNPEETFEKVYKQLGRLLQAEAKRQRWRARAERTFQEALQRRSKSLIGSAADTDLGVTNTETRSTSSLGSGTK
jgi:hypothetical protein